MSRLFRSLHVVFVAYAIVVALQTAADAQYVLSTLHEDSSCSDASTISWTIYTLDCAPTPGGTYARYDCSDSVPVVQVFSQSDCRASSSVVNSTLPTSCSAAEGKFRKFSCGPLQAPNSVSLYSMRYLYFSQSVCTSQNANSNPVSWAQIVGLRNDFCAVSTNQNLFGLSKYSCSSTAFRTTFCTDSSCQNCGLSTMQGSLSTCAPEVQQGTTYYSFGICTNDTPTPDSFNYSSVPQPPVPATPSGSAVKYVGYVDYSSSDCAESSAKSFVTYDVSVCHPGDNVVPSARRYSCEGGVPSLSYCITCDASSYCAPPQNYSTSCSGARKWMCSADEIPYPALGGVYDRRYRAQTSDSCTAGGPSTYATEGSFATCLSSTTVRGLFIERRCEGLVRFDRSCVDAKCQQCMSTPTNNTVSGCTSANLDGTVWSKRECAAPTWTLATASDVPPQAAPVSSASPVSAAPSSSGSAPSASGSAPSSSAGPAPSNQAAPTKPGLATSPARNPSGVPASSSFRVGVDVVAVFGASLLVTLCLLLSH